MYDNKNKGHINDLIVTNDPDNKTKGIANKP